MNVRKPGFFKRHQKSLLDKIYFVIIEISLINGNYKSNIAIRCKYSDIALFLSHKLDYAFACNAVYKRSGVIGNCVTRAPTAS
jgi:hypothetical protein